MGRGMRPALAMTVVLATVVLASAAVNPTHHLKHLGRTHLSQAQATAETQAQQGEVMDSYTPSQTCVDKENTKKAAEAAKAQTDITLKEATEAYDAALTDKTAADDAQAKATAEA